MTDHKILETNRLEFVTSRDGLSGAVEFAKQTYSQYKLALLKKEKRSHLRLREWRRGTVESIVILRRFLRANEDNKVS